MTTADLILDELEKSAEEMLKLGAHDDLCTNHFQTKIAKPIPACTKHQTALDMRVKRFKKALDQFKLLRSTFGTNNYEF